MYLLGRLIELCFDLLLWCEDRLQNPAARWNQNHLLTVQAYAAASLRRAVLEPRCDYRSS